MGQISQNTKNREITGAFFFCNNLYLFGHMESAFLAKMTAIIGICLDHKWNFCIGMLTVEQMSIRSM
ncbi:MAG: hypothetical protein D3923_09610 [Candidatus Electrothrix sp. AR3]|nr:hypothetical protein [Candidatus Electrothrix sp. AR3]